MYTMPVRAIKNILRKELEAFKNDTYSIVRKNTSSDVPSNMIMLAYAELLGILEKSNDYASLEDYISYAGYRMSLEDWINSL